MNLNDTWEIPYSEKEEQSSPEVLPADELIQYVLELKSNSPVRLISIAAFAENKYGIVLDYYFDLLDKKHILRVSPKNSSLYSVASIFPEAELIEREISSVFNLNFVQ